MMILPSIKADYDNYIHFNHIIVNRSVLHVCTQYFTCIYKDIKTQFYSFVLMMLSSPESEKSIRLILTVFTVLGLNCIG